MIHRDVTGVPLQFSREQIEALVDAMPPEHRQLVRELAESIVNPHEIWQGWERDESEKGQWRKTRAYLRFLDLSELDLGTPFGATVVKFYFDTAWQLASVGLVLGTHDDVAERMEAIRSGSLEYSTQLQ